jgi:hypothetical protein
VAQYKLYLIEPIGLATVPFIVTTAYTNPGGYFKGEYFLAIPDQEGFLRAQRFRFNQKSFDIKQATLDENFVLKLVYQRGYGELIKFSRTAAQKHGVALYPRRPEVIETDSDLILSYWMAGTHVKHLSDIGQKTECTELRDHIEWVLTLPDVDKRDL